MNAYELADYLDSNVGASVDSDNPYIDKSATMLRQQADRIAELEKCAGYFRDKYYFDSLDKQNNEPVVWVKKLYSPEIGEWLDFSETEREGMIPLYTHPVKEQLTDEEIGDFTHRMVLCCGVHPNSADINVLGLKFIVEEILRKAQEND